MINPLMSNNTPKMGVNNNILNIVKMLKGGNPEQIAQSLIQKNPQFAQFMQSVQGKTPEQFAQENGINLNEIMSMFK